MEKKKYTSQDFDTKEKRDKRMIDARAEVENGTMTQEKFNSLAKMCNVCDRLEKVGRTAEIQARSAEGTSTEAEEKEFDRLMAELDAEFEADLKEDEVL